MVIHNEENLNVNMIILPKGSQRPFSWMILDFIKLTNKTNDHGVLKAIIAIVQYNLKVSFSEGCRKRCVGRDTTY